jgi:hypothetical protein
VRRAARSGPRHAGQSIKEGGGFRQLPRGPVTVGGDEVGIGGERLPLRAGRKAREPFPRRAHRGSHGAIKEQRLRMEELGKRPVRGHLEQARHGFGALQGSRHAHRVAGLEHHPRGDELDEAPRLR